MGECENKRAITLAEMFAQAINLKFAFEGQEFQIREKNSESEDDISEGEDEDWKRRKNLCQIDRKMSSEMDLEMRRYSILYLRVLSNLPYIKVFDAKFVVPKTLKTGRELIISTEFWYMLLLTIGTVAVIRITVFLLRFDRNT